MMNLGAKERAEAAVNTLKDRGESAKQPSLLTALGHDVLLALAIIERLEEQKEASDVLLRDCLDYIEHMEKHWGGGIAGSVDLKRRIHDSFPAKELQ